ncbi:MAG: CPBP family intramembrane metalloprotease [Dysgonamonadaceae bacterium]|nr:CPBP family intramembrane metalloprotease [Dysgonamonadaceae bacterium]
MKNYSYSNTLIIITCLVYSYFEEYGWRGYLQSELLGMTTLRRIDIITFIWFIWHLNFTISQSNAVFLLILFFASWGIGQIAIKSKSIITCGCFHAIINILYNMQMDKIKILIMTICVACWFLIWYNNRFENY